MGGSAAFPAYEYGHSRHWKNEAHPSSVALLASDAAMRDADDDGHKKPV